ncbi:MAG: YgjV family protein [Ruminococcaceae bacterium]|nr:YgjV family protein [Oscillospiraceae bacterium]
MDFLVKLLTENYDVIAQAVGIVAMAFVILSFQFRSNTVCFAMNLIGGCLFLAHYGMLGAWGGCLMNAVACVMSVVLLIGDRVKKLPVLIGLLGLYAGVTALVMIKGWDSPLALLACVAQFAVTIGMWTRDHVKLRIVRGGVVAPLWIIYNALSGSIGGVICELFTLSSVIVYFVRRKLRGTEAKDNEQ